MICQSGRWTSRLRRRHYLATIIILAAGIHSPTKADGLPDAAGVVAHGDDVRSGGVLAESYAYHHHGSQVPAAASQPGPWYGYGFPVRTHRWGWFGAGRYYPTVIWHKDYNGDTVRWAYRRGY
jgi:hypothetical protein